MLSSPEKRFVRSWEEQRKGGRWLYYLLYISIGTFICSLILAIFLYLFFQVVPGSGFLWFVFSGGLLLSTIISVSTWYFNEKRLKKIIRREISAGEKKDNGPDPVPEY